jgi:hypothetical protein
MNGVSLSTIQSDLFRNGSKSVTQCLNLLESLSIFVSPADKTRFDNYLTAARRFSVLCSDFLDVISTNKDFFVYSILTNYVTSYPKTKQNLADQKELTASVINFYLMKRKNTKLYKPDKDPILKFLKANTTNIYNSIVVITNVMRAKMLIRPTQLPK